MSRRQRNSSSKSGTPKKKSVSKLKGLWWKVLLTVLVVLIIGGIVAYNKVISFLHSDAFREDVSEQVSAKLGTTGELGKFTWSGLDGKNESFKAAGNGFIKSIDVEDVSFDVKLDYIKRDKFRVENISVTSIYSEIDTRESFKEIEIPKKEKSFLASLLPEEIELIDAKVHDLSAKVIMDSGEYSVNGVTVAANKEDDAYKILLNDGRITLPFPFLNSATLVKAELVQLDDEIYIQDTKLEVFKSGEVVLNGVVDFSPRSNKLYDVDGNLSGLRCSDVIPKNWQQHLSGEVRSEFKIRPGAGTEPKIEGELEILDGQLRALPVLDTMAQYFSKDYQTVDFQKFECDFMKFGDQYEMSNLVLISKGLIQLEGDLKINGVNIDGLLNVGLPSKSLSKLPGARGNVFKRGKDGLYWAQIKIGGTFGNITNDIKDRLIQAAIDAGIKDLFKLGEGVLDPDTAAKILNLGVENGVPLEDLPNMLKADNGLLKGGIEGGSEVLKGLLKGITGGANNSLPLPLPGTGDQKEPNNEDGKDDSIVPGIPGIPELPLPKLPELPKGLPLPF